MEGGRQGERRGLGSEGREGGRGREVGKARGETSSVLWKLSHVWPFQIL